MTAPPELLDRLLVQDSFASTDANDQQQVRDMVDLLRDDVAARLAALNAGVDALPVEAAMRELHQLRGALGGFGLVRTGAQLTDLERDWAGLPAAARRSALAQATETLALSLAALEDELPFLRPAARKLA